MVSKKIETNDISTTCKLVLAFDNSNQCIQLKQNKPHNLSFCPRINVLVLMYQQVGLSIWQVKCILCINMLCAFYISCISKPYSLYIHVLTRYVAGHININLEIIFSVYFFFFGFSTLKQGPPKTTRTNLVARTHSQLAGDLEFEFHIDVLNREKKEAHPMSKADRRTP